jgi:uncharacterized membrane protein YedE/YeeE
MQKIVALAVGLIFGFGLCISGMIDPSKVLGFLDLGGSWDPSLAFVMGGALVVGFVAFSFAKRRRTAFDGAAIELPTARAIDRSLVLGSLIFGIGWGLAGICPGPGIVDLGFFNPQAMVFVAAMAVGMLAYRRAGLGLRAAAPITQDA